MSVNLFYDAHTHCINNESGGIVIAMEGKPYFEGTFYNHEIQQMSVVSHNDDKFKFAYYVDSSFCAVPDETILKYHARREKYTPEQVTSDIAKRKCKICIIDTLNQPYWSYLDYWRIIKTFPNITFLLPHLGGYDIVDFIKILDFNSNVYGDFSMTQEYFGWCGERSRLGVVADAIDFCLNSEKLHKKILFGSDEPFFSQQVAFEKYLQYKYSQDILVNNFERLISIL